MKITISGTLGSGKSTVGKMLAKSLNYDYYYTGNKTREMAQQRGMALLDFVKLRDTDPSINLEIDNWQKEIGKTKDNFILDGHVGFVFVPDSIKIFLKCPVEVAADRVLKSFNEGDAQRQKEGLKNDRQEMIENMKKRTSLEDNQYKELYDVDFNDESNFDIVIDTSKISPEEVCEKILAFVKRKQTKKGRKR